jgi:hypothetical protein
MHSMGAPERRYRMEHHVLEVDRQVERQNETMRVKYFGGPRALSRPPPRAAQKPAGPTAPSGSGAHGKGVKNQDGEVCGPTGGPGK